MGASYLSPRPSIEGVEELYTSYIASKGDAIDINTKYIALFEQVHRRYKE
jgi:hypothetical protein